MTSPLTAIDNLALHPRLEALLRRVQTAERAATGPQRRPTFKLMRELLGASVQLGVPPRALAECLGSSTGAVRNRAVGADGALTAELVEQLTGLSPRELDDLSGGELTGGVDVDRATFTAIDVVRALLATPRPTPSARGGQSDPGRKQPSSAELLPVVDQAEAFGTEEG